MKRRTLIKGAAAGTAALGAAVSLPARFAAAAFAPLQAPIPAVTLEGGETHLGVQAVAQLRKHLKGQLLTASDPAYDAARQLWSASFDRHPSLIAQCASADDVAATVQFAREQGLLTAIKCGGHSFSGKSAADGGLMIDLGFMNEVAVDPAARVARAGGGARLGSVDRASLEHRLVTVVGTDSDTGVAGLTLGGGIGRLNRKWGLTIDNLLSAQVVTADGRILEVSAEENPDLFWAIRGGGGNFGVVTRFDYRLHPFNPDIYGGNILWPWEQRKQVLAAVQEMAAVSSEDVFCNPFMFVRKDGNPAFGMELLYFGEHGAGEETLAAYARLGKPAHVNLKVFPYIETQLTPPDARRQSHYIKTSYVEALSADVIEATLDGVTPLPGMFFFFHPMGGAVARVAPQETAFPHRSAGWAIGLGAGWDGNEHFEQYRDAIRRQHARLEPHTVGFYANLMNTSQEGRMADNYGINQRRLQQLKAKYDPDNFFRLNANILPAGAEVGVEAPVS